MFKETIEGQTNYCPVCDVEARGGKIDGISGFVHTCRKEELSEMNNEQAIEEYKKELRSNIGFLRQWLNEDRISDASKMVSSEQLEKWLFDFKK